MIFDKKIILIKLNKNKSVLFIFLILIFLLSILIINKLNPYLRTDIFRSFAKGNWHITSEADTIYTAGYYGVRKYLFSDLNNLRLLSKNEEFCKDRMIGRGVCINGDYIYVTARSFLPGSVRSKKKMGQLLIFKKNNLKKVKEFTYDIKLVQAKIFKNTLVISGLEGFDIYDSAIPNNPKLLFSYRSENYKEYQGFDFLIKDGKLHVIFSLFAEGIEIWDISIPENATFICTVPITKKLKNGNNLHGGQSMDIITKYPYIYATLGPTKETFNTIYDRRGILVYDISDIKNIKMDVIFIPKKDWYKKTTGDKQPTYMTSYKNTLYVNSAEKGVAMFDISNSSSPTYKGLIDVSDNSTIIQPIYANNKGILFAGSYYWSSIFGLDLNKENKN